MPFLANLLKDNVFPVSAENIPALIAGLAICLTSTDSMAGKDREARPVSLPVCLDRLTLGYREEDSGRAGSRLSDTDDISQGAWSQDSLQALAKFLSGRTVELQQGGRAESSETIASKTIEDENIEDETKTQKAESVFDRSSFSQELKSIRKLTLLMGSRILEPYGVLYQPEKLWRWQPSESGKYALPFTVFISTRGAPWQPTSVEVGSIIEPLVTLISKDGILVLDGKEEASPVLVKLRVLCREGEKRETILIYQSDGPEQFGGEGNIDKWSQKMCPVFFRQNFRKLIAEYLLSLLWALGRHNAGGVLSIAASQTHSLGCRKDLILKQSDSNKALMVDYYFEDDGLTVVVRSHFDTKLAEKKFSQADANSALQLTYRFVSENDGLTRLRCIYFHFMTDYQSRGLGWVKEKAGWRSQSRRPSIEPVGNLYKSRSTPILDQLDVSENRNSELPLCEFPAPQYQKQVSEPAGMIFDLGRQKRRYSLRGKKFRVIPFEMNHVATNCDDLACDDIERCQQALGQKNYELLMQLTLQPRPCLESNLTEFREWYKNKVAAPAKAATRLKITSASFEQELRKAMNVAELTFQEAEEFCPRVVFHPGTLSFPDYMELQKILTNYIHLRKSAKQHYLEARELLETVSEQQCLYEKDLNALVQIVVNVVAAERTFRSRASPLGGKIRRLEVRLMDGVLFVPHDYQRNLLLYYQSLIGQVLNLIAVKGQVSMENVSRILQLYEEHMSSGNQHRIVRKIRSDLSLPNNQRDRTYQELRDELFFWQLRKDTNYDGLKWFTACMSGAHTDLTD